jgi:hypothetical protein
MIYFYLEMIFFFLEKMFLFLEKKKLFLEKLFLFLEKIFFFPEMVFLFLKMIFFFLEKIYTCRPKWPSLLELQSMNTHYYAYFLPNFLPVAGCFFRPDKRLSLFVGFPNNNSFRIDQNLPERQQQIRCSTDFVAKSSAASFAPSPSRVFLSSLIRSPPNGQCFLTKIKPENFFCSESFRVALQRFLK